MRLTLSFGLVLLSVKKVSSEIHEISIKVLIIEKIVQNCIRVELFFTVSISIATQSLGHNRPDTMDWKPEHRAARLLAEATNPPRLGLD